ncbi:hypothetical protein L1987_15384 [Smallanthus sonchifolius]|uniref:Uncharacterized protein n=1 Tax=Smallanthus sonchifolius TaxID=185202 RepID=A0ACB9J805_9ASTR|nr:hypothetical protein L1987_15384 [Smallanthus sonchifolius]
MDSRGTGRISSLQGFMIKHTNHNDETTGIEVLEDRDKSEKRIFVLLLKNKSAADRPYLLKTKVAADRHMLLISKVATDSNFH